MNNERVKILSKLRLIRVILASVYRCEGIVKSGHHKNVPLPLMHMNAASPNRPDIGRRGGNANVTNRPAHLESRMRETIHII